MVQPPKREAEDSPSAKFMNEWSHTTTPHTLLWLSDGQMYFPILREIQTPLGRPGR